MLGRDFAGTNSNIGLGAVQKATVVEQPQIDLAGALTKSYTGWNDAKNKQALTEALKSGDNEAINNAYADYDVVGALSRNQALADMQSKMDWQEKMGDIAYQRDLNKLNIAQKNAMDLANYKASLTNANAKPTEKMRNYQFLLEQGYTPEQATKAVFSNGKSDGISSDVQNQSTQNAQRGIDALKELADTNALGIYSAHSPLKSTQNARGKLSGAIAAIAPMGIQRLKDAGVSGVNTLGEFMTYIGLPQNPTSAEIKGALPIIAQTLGLDNPYNTNQTMMPQGNFANMSDDELLKGL